MGFYLLLQILKKNDVKWFWSKFPNDLMILCVPVIFFLIGKCVPVILNLKNLFDFWVAGCIYSFWHLIIHWILFSPCVCGDCILIIFALLQAKALLSRLTEEKNNAAQLNNKLRQELVRTYKIYVVDNFYYWFLFLLFLTGEWRW